MVLLWIALAGCSRETVGQGPSQRYAAELSQDCSENYIVVFARGSSQPQEVTGQPETRRFFDAIDEVLRHDVTLGFVSVEYPALGGQASNWEAYRTRAASGAYHDSRLAGSQEAARWLNERNARCDKAEAGSKDKQPQRFILGGYSQGAHAMREALFLLDAPTRARVAYVALFGDPTFRDSRIAQGTYAKGVEGVFGGPKDQVPAGLAEVSRSYCDMKDFFCGGGRKPGDLVTNQVKELLGAATGQKSAHALYPFQEMHDAAAQYLKQRSLPGTLPRVDTNSGGFEGRYEGVAGCRFAGEVGQSEPGLYLYLVLDIRREGTDLGGREPVDRLTAVLTYEDTSAPERKRLGQAQLKGTGTEGRVDLRHEKWLSGGKGLTPLDIVAGATAAVRGDGPVADAKKVTSLATALSGHQGCFYRLE
ncbi:cutinase family protein [Streptomyces sp. NPDC003952]